MLRKNKKMMEGKVVSGTITKAVEGGMIVKNGKIEMFLPGEEIDKSNIYVKKFAYKKGKFKISKSIPNLGVYVVSIKKILGRDKKIRSKNKKVFVNTKGKRSLHVNGCRSLPKRKNRKYVGNFGFMEDALKKSILKFGKVGAFCSCIGISPDREMEILKRYGKTDINYWS